MRQDREHPNRLGHRNRICLTGNRTGTLQSLTPPQENDAPLAYAHTQMQRSIICVAWSALDMMESADAFAKMSSCYPKKQDVLFLHRVPVIAFPNVRLVSPSLPRSSVPALNDCCWSFSVLHCIRSTRSADLATVLLCCEHTYPLQMSIHRGSLRTKRNPWSSSEISSQRSRSDLMPMRALTARPLPSKIAEAGTPPRNLLGACA